MWENRPEGGWYEAGAMATVSVAPTSVVETPLIIRVFEGWVDENGTLVSSSLVSSDQSISPISKVVSQDGSS